MTAGYGHFKTIKTEFIRKSIHFSIALSPLMAAWDRLFTLIFLMAGVLVYTLLEMMRIRGVTIPVISALTVQSSRPRDEGHFVPGPVTLGLGALLTILFYPPQTAAIAIYALAFGDGFASLLGKPFGHIKPAFLSGKSLEGSIACFTAVFIASWKVSGNTAVSLAAAITASIIEAMPLEDLDNIAIPLTVAAVLSLF